MAMVSSYIDVDAPIGADEIRRIRALDNNALILRLHFTINHLSRWLSPIHDRRRLERAVHFAEPTVKDLLLAMRDEEHRVVPKLHLISVQNDPDLDKIPPYQPPADRDIIDARRAPIELLAEFRRLRQATCSVLRSLPDDAWRRQGTSRLGYDVTVRSLAEGLAEHDYRYLKAIDIALDRSGAREGLAAVQKAHLEELLRLVPETLKI